MKNILRIKYFLFFNILLTFSFFISISGRAQDTVKNKNNCDLNVTSDIVSRYVWRGQDLYNTPSIQPTLEFSCHNFTIGSWGSFSITSTDIQETQFYASYAYKYFKLNVNDYFYMNYARDPLTGMIKNNHFFDYGKNTTHILEGDFIYKGPDNFPFSFLAAYNFYGNDSNNSSYFELGYSGTIHKTDFDVFIGCTPDKGWYATTLGIVNVGITGYKKISVTKDYDIILKTSLIANPQAENVFLVFGITL